MIHFSCNEIKAIQRVEEQNTIKPRGLWYSTGTKWIDFFRKNIDKIKKCRYVYRLELNYTRKLIPDPQSKKVLRIKDEITFDEFTLKYGLILKDKYTDLMFDVFIDWSRVKEDCGGIEVIPLIKSRINTKDPEIIKKYNERFKFIPPTRVDDIVGIYLGFWLRIFDIDSGCVWDPDAVKSIKRIYKI